jgi:hypothetical protein
MHERCRRGLPLASSKPSFNVTSPTGIRAIARFGGPDVAAKIWDTIEAKRAKP